MAEQPKVSILLQLKDELSKGIEGVSGKLASFGKTVVALAATAALGKFFKDSVEEAAKSEASLARLSLAVKNTGNDFDRLKAPLSGTIDKLAELTTFTDEDLSDALANLITLTGDVAGSQKNLALVADLAVARQMSLSAASDVVGKAMNGNVTALNKLGFAGTDATAVLETLRQSVGGFAEDQAKTFQGRLENLTKGWGEFKESVGRAILSTGSAGEAVGGLTGLLANAANWVEHNQVAIGGLIDGLIGVGRVIGAIIEPFIKPFIAGLMGIEWEAGNVLVALGWLIEQGGALLKKLGFDVGDGLAKELKASGERMVTAAEQGIAKLKTVVTEADIARTKAAEAEANKRLKRTKEALAEQAKAEQQYAKDLEDATRELAVKLKMLAEGWTEAEAKEWVKRQTAMGRSLGVQVTTLDDAYTQIDRANLLLRANFDQIIPTMKRTESTLGELRGSGVLPTTDAIDLLAKQLGVSREEAERIGFTFTSDTKPSFDDVARAAIGIGQALGEVDDKAAAALHNLVSIGESFGTGNVIGVIGGLSGLLGSIFAGDKERLAMVRRNAEATEKLASVNGELLTLNTPGRKFAAVQAVFNDPAFAAAAEGATKAGGRKDLLVNLLLQHGLSVSDFFGVAKDLGYDFSGGLTASGLSQFRQGIGQVQFSSFGNTWRDQLSRIGTGIDIGAISSGDELSQILGAVGAGGPNAILGALSGLDLSSAAGSSTALGNLRDLFNNIGSLSASDFGGLTGSEFVEAIQRIIGLLTDDVADIGGVLVPSGISTSEPTVPVVFDTIASETTEQTSILTEIRDGIGDLTDTVRRQGAGVGGAADAERLNEQLAVLYRLDQMAQGVAVRT